MASAGQRLGEYVLREAISSGAFGEVWLAHHHVWSDQLVAVKIPKDPQYLRDLQREGLAVKGLVHPNIVSALGFDPYADPPYLVMEYVPGTSLRPLIQKRSLSPQDAVVIMRQVLAGLAYAHGRSLIHRDIKPENILVHQDAAQSHFAGEGLVKLTDFGLGRSRNIPGGSIAYSTELKSPAERDIAGSLDYMAPEQRSGGEIDARADLYACGVVLYEMLTGERPAGTDVPSDLNQSVPKHLDAVFRRSYARLDRRFASADEFSAALTAASPPPIPGQAVRRRPIAFADGAHCPRCTQPVQAGDQFCIHCGVQLVENVRRCPRCGAYPDESDQYCMFCGQTLVTQLVSS